MSVCAVMQKGQGSAYICPKGNTDFQPTPRSNVARTKKKETMKYTNSTCSHKLQPKIAIISISLSKRQLREKYANIRPPQPV